MKQTVSNDLFWPNIQEQAVAKKKSVTIPSSRWEFHSRDLPADRHVLLLASFGFVEREPKAPRDVQDIHTHGGKICP